MRRKIVPGNGKSRIRNMKERKIWSQNFNRDKSQLERFKGKEKKLYSKHTVIQSLGWNPGFWTTVSLLENT